MKLPRQSVKPYKEYPEIKEDDATYVPDSETVPHSSLTKLETINDVFVKLEIPTIEAQQLWAVLREANDIFF